MLKHVRDLVKRVNLKPSPGLCSLKTNSIATQADFRHRCVCLQSFGNGLCQADKSKADTLQDGERVQIGPARTVKTFKTVRQGGQLKMSAHSQYPVLDVRYVLPKTSKNTIGNLKPQRRARCRNLDASSFGHFSPTISRYN